MAKLFTDNNGVVAPIGAGLLYGLSDGVEPRSLLDFYSNKIHFTRIFAGRLTPSDTRTGQSPENAIARLPEVLEWHRERNLRTELTACTDTAGGSNPAYDIEAHCNEIARIANDYEETVIGVEVFNEVGHLSQWPISHSGLINLKNIIAARYKGPIALGAASIDELDVNTGEYPTAWTGHNAYSTVHLNRDKKPSYREAFRIKEQHDIRNEHDCGVCNNEPGRFDHESLDNEWDGMGHERFAYILGCLGIAFNFMSIAHGSQMRDCIVPTGVELSAFNAFLRGASKIPRGRYDWYNANNTGNHPESPVKNGAFMEGPANSPWKALWRAYSYIGTFNFVIAGGDNPAEFNIEYQNDFAMKQIVDEFASTQIIEIEQR